VYEAKFIFDDRYCKSVYDFNGIKFFAATVDYLELPEGFVVYGRRVSLSIVESIVTDSEK
jgi:hypothetical protein